MAERTMRQWLILVPLLLCLAVGLLFVVAPFYEVFTKGPEEIRAAGGWPDVLAPANTFLTLAAVAGAILAVHLQRQELHETREEMKEQRKQFELTASAQQRLADSQEALALEQAIANAHARETMELESIARRVSLLVHGIDIEIQKAKLAGGDEAVLKAFESAKNALRTLESREVEVLDYVTKRLDKRRSELAARKNPVPETTDGTEK
jgi:hypothetical protein